MFFNFLEAAVTTKTKHIVYLSCVDAVQMMSTITILLGLGEDPYMRRKSSAVGSFKPPPAIVHGQGWQLET